MTAQDSETTRRTSLDLIRDDPVHLRKYLMGPKKIRALALISDLLYGSAPSWRDPVKYSFTHGGKDGYPYPVDRDAYDNSIRILKDSLESASKLARRSLSPICAMILM